MTHKPSLGLCFFGNQLFYAVNSTGNNHELERIGSYDFNIDVTKTLRGNSKQHIQGIQQTVQQVKEEFDIQRLCILSSPSQECWTTVPKIVYDEADEREKHINILMSGVPRKHIHPTWYNLSNQNYKFLLLRHQESVKELEKLSSNTASTDLISEFEIGSRWVQHAHPGGSFLTIGCFRDCISVSSFILGKLRGATYIPFDDLQDLPYFWMQYTQTLPWMKGLHEQTYVYGLNAFRVIDILEPFWDDAGKITKMDTLQKMQIKADEQTYSFNLEQAFPAMMLALNYD